MKSDCAASSKRTWFIGLLCAICAQILFGTTFAFNKYVINQNVDPILMGFNRTWIAVVCLFPFYVNLRHTTRWSKADWRLVIFIGSFATAGAMILEYMGTKYTTASNASLIVTAESVLAIFLAVLILKEKLHKPTLIGGLGALFGMAMVMWEDIQAFQIRGGSNLIGDLLVLCSIFCWCLYTINSKRILRHSNPLVAHFFVTLFCSLSLGSVVLFRGTWREITAMNESAWMATFYLGSACSGFALWLYYQALKRLPASLVSITLTLLPVTGVFFSVFLLGEHLSPHKIAGGLAIVIGVGYAVWPQEGRVPITDEVPPVG